MHKLLLAVLLSFTTTLGSPPQPTPEPSPQQYLSVIPPKQINCLAEAIYHEARGEPILGQVAVGMVVLNRTQTREFSGTICDVVYAKNQFTWTATPHRQPSGPEFVFAQNLATSLIRCTNDEVCSNYIPPYLKSITFFSVGGFRNKNLNYVATIGMHRFYRFSDEYNENKKNDLLRKYPWASCLDLRA